MEAGQPSRTAYGAALHRAAHQTIERGAIFADSYACAILGLTPEQAAAEEGDDPHRRRMRLFIAARARFAEDSLARAVAAGVRQVVVLGAGLDTFALRNPYRDLGVKVFEVDHPSTQTWKRQRLAAISPELPPLLTFAPVDFERESLAEGLDRAGFDAARPAFFIWLGVTPYLTAEAIEATLACIARAAGSEVAFDYVGSLRGLSPERQRAHEAFASRVASLGEQLMNGLETDELRAMLDRLGLTEQEDLDIDAIAVRYFGRNPGSVGASPGHLMRCRRPLNPSA